MKVLRSDQTGVKLVRGFFIVEAPRVADGDEIGRLLEAWYGAKARHKFAERLEANLPRFSGPEKHRPTRIMVRQLKRRWGSMSPSGRLLLNRRLIQAPTECIDYVITHELCHRAEAHHGPAFIELLGRVMPDWPRRKERLEKVMA
ncbi:MAG: M48 family metallopeptidase [Rhodospirillales bacterium]|nr:M48 family metallopeptidase [Rhodospirillales bacterium]